jgi:uncharacterized protein with beta-barrel porin domain
VVRFGISGAYSDMSGTSFLNNTAAGGNGGALRATNAYISATGGDLVFKGNTASNAPNAIYIDNYGGSQTLALAAGAGHTIYFYDPIASDSYYPNFTVKINDLSDNANFTGAVLFDGQYNANFSNIYGNTTVGGGVMKLANGATYNNNDDITNTKGIFTLNSGAMLDFSGGRLQTKTLIGAGKYAFDLGSYIAAETITTPIITAATGANLAGASFGLSGGANGTYSLISNVTADDGAADKLSALSNPVRTYTGLLNGATLQVTVAMNSGDNNLKDAALADSSSNGGIADALIDNFDDLPQGVAEALEAEGRKGFGELGYAISQLNGANSTSAAVALANHATIQDQAAYGEFVGENATAQVALDRVNMGNLGGRASLGGKSANTPLRRGWGGLSAGNREAVDGVVSGLTGFAKAYGGFGANKSTHAATGYDFGGVGLISGLGYKFSRELELGALIGYSYNHSELYRHFGEVTDNVLRLGAYGNYTFDNFYFNTAPTFGIHLLDTERHLDFMNQTAKADRTGFDFSWYNRFGYTFELPKNIFLTPSYALGMSYLHNPSYTEYGAAAALKVNDHDSWSLNQNLELRLGKLFQISNSFAILPEIWGGWEHEYLSANDVTMRFAAIESTQWSAPVTRIADDRAVFGAGVTTLISNKYEVFGRYNQRLWDGGHSSTFTAGVSVKF